MQSHLRHPDRVNLSRQQQTPITDLLRSFNDQSVSELVTYYRPLLYEIARREWNRKYERRIGISDIVQSTFVSMAKCVPNESFIDRHHFKKFLTTLLRNHLRSFRRVLLSKKRTIDKEVPFTATSSTFHIAVRDRTDQLDIMIETELIHKVLISLKKLPREVQRLIRWRYRKGMTFRQIGERIDRKPDDVRYLLDRCISEIAKDLRTDSFS